MAKRTLNNKLIDALPRPKKGRRSVFDKLVPGLHVRFTASGLKTFSILYRDHSGKQRRTSLGRWPGTTVAVAREKARKIIEAASEGRARDSVEEVAKLFVDDAKPHIASWKTIERVLANHVLPVLGDRPIRDIDRAAVHALLDGMIADGKPGAAREVRKHMSNLLNWATERGHVDANAIAGMKRRDLVAPDAGRALTSEELRAVWSAATTLGYPFGDLYRLLLLTGQRRGDWCRASWTEIEDGVLAIPAERYKSRRDHVVPLSEPAQEIVDGLPRHKGPYLFSTLDGHSPVETKNRHIGIQFLEYLQLVPRPRPQLDNALLARHGDRLLRETVAQIIVEEGHGVIPARHLEHIAGIAERRHFDRTDRPGVR